MDNVSPLFVLILGMGTVFIGLIALILLTNLMSFVLNKNGKTPETAPKAAPAAAQSCEIADRKAFDAAVCAAVATYMGNEPAGLRIRSIRKV